MLFRSLEGLYLNSNLFLPIVSRAEVLELILELLDLLLAFQLFPLVKYAPVPCKLVMALRDFLVEVALGIFKEPVQHLMCLAI